MKQTIGIASLVLASMAPAIVAPAGAAPAVPLAPTGKWVVEYHPNLCVASHQFVDGDRRVTLGFRPWPMGDRVELVTVVPGKPGEAHRGAASVTLGGVGATSKGEYLQWFMAKSAQRMTVVTVDKAATAQLANAPTIAISLDGRPPVTLALEKTGAVLAALKTCNDDLLQGWGVDPTEGDRIAKPAISKDVSNWVSDTDYPNGASSGEVVILWAIETDGRVRSCRVVASSGDPLLDKASCDAIVRRARYAPAVGLDGKPMISHSTRHIIWRLPD